MDQQIDISKLSDADKKELNNMLEAETQRTSLQQSKKNWWIDWLNFYILYMYIYTFSSCS